MGRKKSFLLIGGVVVLLVIFLGIMLITNENKDKFKDDYEEIEKNIVDNLLYLSSGYNTDYFGTEKLFESSNLKFKNLKDENLLATAVNIYNMEIEDVNEEINVDSEKLSNYETYILVKGSIIKDYIKKIFNIDWEHKSVKSSVDFIYNFDYDKDSDAYIIYPSEAYKDYEDKLDDFKSSIVIEPISSTSTKNTVKTTIIVAYSTYTENDDKTVNIKYYKDKEQKNFVFEINSNDLYTVDENNNIVKNENVDTLKKHSDDFKKYVVTSTKNDDGFALSKIKKK